MSDLRIHYLCKDCGSSDVFVDASAHWDPEQSDWVLRSTHDATYCTQCAADCELVKLNEANDIEVQGFGMVATPDGTRLVEDHEMPQSFDLIVKTIPVEAGGVTSETFTLLEYDDLTRERVEERLVYVDYLYPFAGVERLFGAAPR